MKELLSIAVVIVTAALLSFTKNYNGKLKLYPEIEKFYESLPNAPVSPDYATVYRDFSAYILQGAGSESKIDLVFTCSDNSFRSQAAQIILQSLLSVNKYNKLVVSSCAASATEINPKLISILARHGFIVTEQTNTSNGKKAYEVKFGDNMSPLKIYAKSADDNSISKAGFFQLALCEANSCSDLPNAKFKYRLSYKIPDTNASDNDLDKAFTAVANDVVYSFNKAVKQ